MLFTLLFQAALVVLVQGRYIIFYSLINFKFFSVHNVYNGEVNFLYFCYARNIALFILLCEHNVYHKVADKW